MVWELDARRAKLGRNISEDFLNRASCIDKLGSRGILGGNSPKAGGDFFLERDALKFKAVLRTTTQAATIRLFNRHIEHKGEIRAATIHRKLIGLGNHVAIEPVRKRLVSGGGIVKTIAHHRATGGKRGLNYLMHELGAGRLVQ